MAALAWIPWIFWSVHRALNKDQFQSWILVVLFLSLQLLTGYPPFVFYTVILLAAWFFFQRPSRGNILGLGLSFLGALGLTALQWLPFAEFLALGSHGGWWKYFPYYLLPAEYLTLFRFDVLGIPGSKDYGGTSANFVYNLYFGLVPLCLLLAGGWGTDKKKSSAFWGFAALFLLLWMAGGHFPLWRLFPENLLQGLEPSKAAPLFIFSASTYIAGRLQIRLSKPMKPIFFFVVLFLSLLWMVDLMRIPFAFANRIPNPFENADLARKAAQLKELAAGQRILSLTSDEEFGRSRTQGLLDPIVVPVQKMLVNTNIVWGLRSTQFYLTVWPESLNNLFLYTSQGYPYSGDLLDIAGVRLFLLSQPLPGPKYIPLEIGGDQDINLNPKASADIRWVPEKVELADRPAVLRRIAVPGSLWDRRIYVEKTADGREISLEPSLRDNPQTLAAGYQRSSAGWTSFSGNFQPGWVVFNETCFPGWRAWVDGKGKPILRTYGLFMGVAVEAGNHQVEFRYEPASFRLGLFLSLLTLAALLGRLAQPKTKKF